jgi:hypothetical protein
MRDRETNKSRPWLVIKRGTASTEHLVHITESIQVLLDTMELPISLILTLHSPQKATIDIDSHSIKPEHARVVDSLLTSIASSIEK